MQKNVKVFMAVWLAALTASLLYFYWIYWIQLYPNYLRFQRKFKFQNKYYGLQLTSFITDLWLADDLYTVVNSHSKTNSITAYWRILPFEENYQGRWNLEVFDRREIFLDNETVIIVKTWSHLYTYNITKTWVFFKMKPYFQVELQRTYLFNSVNMNNQLIVDVKNKAVHYGERWVAYEMEVGAFGYVILQAKPNNVTVQAGHPTETQINFYGARDRTVRAHRLGEVEYLKLLVYANQYGTWKDVLGYAPSLSNSEYIKPAMPMVTKIMANGLNKAVKDMNMPPSSSHMMLSTGMLLNRL